ncbi:MAG: hypothetical protein ACOYT4_01510 [Nanoarchaeota archaeon]
MKNKEKTFEQIMILIKNKNFQDNKKAKKLAMKNNIQLKELRKEFCQECFYPLEQGKIRIKNGYKKIKCKNCSKLYRFKIKN